MEILRQLAAAALVIGLLALALWALRRRSFVRFRAGRSGRPRLLECRERLTLTSQHAVHLVRAGDRALVLAVSASACTLLDNRPWEEMAGAGVSEVAALAGGRE